MSLRSPVITGRHTVPVAGRLAQYPLSHAVNPGVKGTGEIVRRRLKGTSGIQPIRKKIFLRYVTAAAPVPVGAAEDAATTPIMVSATPGAESAAADRAAQDRERAEPRPDRGDHRDRQDLR